MKKQKPRFVIDGKVMPPDLVAKTIQRKQDIDCAQRAVTRAFVTMLTTSTASARSSAAPDTP